MKRGYRGSITIYLILTLLVLLSLLLTMIDHVRSQAARLMLECAVDASLYSIFAEYQRELLDQYDLFFVDTGYGDVPSVSNTQKHFEHYLKDNFDLPAGGMALPITDFMKMDVQQTEVIGCSRASDEEGMVFKRQAVSYMKERYGVSYLEQYTGHTNEVMQQMEEKGLLDRNVDAERDANQQVIDGIDIPPVQTGEDEYEDIFLDNPADGVNASKNAGILYLAVPDAGSLSSQTIIPGQYISRQHHGEGMGLHGRDKPAGAESVWYHEYLLEKCSCYTNVLDKAKLKYQIEYILAGKSSDIDNLKWVVERLFLLREAANAAYLFSDAGKVLEAETLALSLTAVMLVPELAEPVKLSILFAWSLAESVYDVRQLLLGRRIPAWKNAQTWHYSLQGMLHFQSDLPTESMDQAGEEKAGNLPGNLAQGLSYQDYLRMLLLATPERDCVFRMMDIIEMDIRKTEGGSRFSMYGCIDDLAVRVFGGSRYDTTWEIEREYCYF